MVTPPVGVRGRLLKIDPVVLGASKTVRSCPQCSSKHYEVKNRMRGDELTCEAITCMDCGFDILGAYRAMQDKGAQS